MPTFSREPAAYLGFAGAAIALGIAFGLKLSTEQVGAIMAFVTAGMGLVIRQQVTPVAKLKENDIDPETLK